MIRPMILIPALAALCAVPSGTTAQTAPPVTQGAEVVVTGVSLKDSAAALKACIARKCPPDEDIRATLAHAENEFVAGDYHAARAALQSSIGRNKRHAKQFPVQVSDLLRANSRVAAHLGESESFMANSADVVAALKAGLDDNDPRVLAAQIEVGDGYARTRQIEAAVEQYNGVARHAHALNLPVVEGYARLRTAILYAALSDRDPGTYRGEANRAINVLVNGTDPRLKTFALAAKLLRAQMAAKSGDPAAIDRLVDEYRSAGSGIQTVLLYAPKIKLPEQSDRSGSGGENINQLAMENFENQWVDISFWVTPAGKVSDAQVLRQSPQLAGRWVQPIVASIADRRYAPLKMDPQDPGVLRVERYSFTSHWTERLGTRIRQREAIPQIEMVDLSRDPEGTK